MHKHLLVHNANEIGNLFPEILILNPQVLTVQLWVCMRALNLQHQKERLNVHNVIQR